MAPPRVAGSALLKTLAPILHGIGLLVIEQSTKHRASIVSWRHKPSAGVYGFDGETSATPSLPLLCFGRGIQGDESSLKRAADLRKLRPHSVSERHGFPVPMSEVSRS